MRGFLVDYLHLLKINNVRNRPLLAFPIVVVRELLVGLTTVNVPRRPLKGKTVSSDGKVHFLTEAPAQNVFSDAKLALSDVKRALSDAKTLLSDPEAALSDAKTALSDASKRIV